MISQFLWYHSLVFYICYQVFIYDIIHDIIYNMEISCMISQFLWYHSLVFCICYHTWYHDIYEMIIYMISYMISYIIWYRISIQSILEAQMSSASGASTVHRRFACMGCTARRGETTFFNDYQSAASHYSRSIHCNKSTRGIKAVTVQLNTRPQHVGDGVARAGGAPGVWRPQPAPSRRAAGAMI